MNSIEVAPDTSGYAKSILERQNLFGVPLVDAVIMSTDAMALYVFRATYTRTGADILGNTVAALRTSTGTNEVFKPRWSRLGRR